MIALIDSNVWISGFLNPRGMPGTLANIWKSTQSFQNVCSMTILDEIGTTLFEPRIYDKYRLNATEIHKLLELISVRSLLVSAPGQMTACRDPHDNHILEAALIAKAEYIVTRDDDMKRDRNLIDLFASYGIQIISVRQFLQILSAEGHES